MRISFYLIPPIALGSLISGCKPKSPVLPQPSAPPPPKEMKPMLGGPINGHIRLQILPSPNPAYMGLEAFDITVSDPFNSLRGIPNTKVALILQPPSKFQIPPAKSSVVTDKNGMASAKIALGASGDWTLTAVAVSPKNGTAKLTHTVAVGLLPGQTDEAPKVPAGPVRSPESGASPSPGASKPSSKK